MKFSQDKKNQTKQNRKATLPWSTSKVFGFYRLALQGMYLALNATNIILESCSAEK